MLSYGLERKEAFEDHENVKFLKYKKWVFAKVVNPWFWLKKSTIFSSLFFSKTGLEKC